MNSLERFQERPRWLFELLSTAILTSLLLALALRIWRHDISVPFNYWGDTLLFSALTHGLLLNGWPHHVPQLGAPFGFEAAAFPSLTTSDWALTWLIGRFVDSPGAALNLFWMLSIVLTALSALVALRLLGAGRNVAIVSAVLYALLPAAFVRNTAHISLVYYTVPLLAAFCVALLNRDERGQRWHTLFVCAVVAALLQGLNYIYFTFFAAGLILLCALWAGLANGDGVAFRRAAVVMAVMLVSGAANLAPAVLSWHHNGRPPAMNYKSPAEAEVYGLKLRRLLLPHERNALPVLGAWARADRNAQFPHENENEAARLGSFGAVALVAVFLLLVALALGRVRAIDGNARGAASLAFVTFLITTVGGLGAVFNVLVLPDIRAYNRFSVFLAFFAFTALALLITDALSRLRETRWHGAAVAGVAVLVTLSAYDQLLDAGRLTGRYAMDQEAAQHEKTVVRALEAALRPGAMVFQFPVTPFPPDPGRLQMSPYDHARPFLWSSHLRWSWPTFSHRHHAWDQQLLALPQAEWARKLVLSGFDAVWIDRNGADDRGAALESALLGAGAVRVAFEVSARYGLVDLAPVKSRLQMELGDAGFARAAAAAMPVAAVDYGQGFYAPEVGQGGRQFRWMQREANLSVRNFAGTPVRAELALALQSGGPGEVAVLAEGREIGRLRSSLAGEENALTLTLEPRATISLRMVSQHPALNAPNDPRALYTTLLSLQLRPSTPALQAPAK